MSEEKEVAVPVAELDLAVALSGRHPGTQQIGRWFRYHHLRHGLARDLSANCSQLAQYMVESLPDGPELTAGLRKLLEAKDCFVRAGLPPAT